MSDDSFQMDPASPPEAIRASAPEFVPASLPPQPHAAPAGKSAPAEIFNRVPLMQPPMSQPSMPQLPPPPRLYQHPRPPPPPPHPYPPMMPLHSYGSFCPFPEPVPFYPPVCPSPMPGYMPGPPGPLGPHGAHSFHNLHHPSVQHPPLQHPSMQHPPVQHPPVQHPPVQHPLVQHPPGNFFRPDANPNPARDGPPAEPSSREFPRPAATATPPAPVGGVMLTKSECEIFKVLCSANPEIAQKYMSDAITRAMREALPSTAGGAPAGERAPSVASSSVASSTTVASTMVTMATCVRTARSALNPEAAEFRLVAAGTQTDRPLLPFQIEPLPAGERPPPGFGPKTSL